MNDITLVDLQKQVEDKVLEVYLKAQQAFNRAFNLCSIEYKDMGRTGGKAWYSQNKIQLSPTLLKENGQKYIESTVVHEIGHLITHKVYPFSKAHGREWKHVMVKIGGEPKRCHSYDVSSVQRSRNTKRYIYKCDCTEHSISATIHNRIVLYKQQRYCKKCKVIVKWSGHGDFI